MLALRKFYENTKVIPDEQLRKTVVPTTWIARATRESLFTPDISQVEQFQSRLVFIYNQAMESHYQHTELLGPSEPLGTVYTLANNLSLWKKRLGKASFPIALSGIEKGPEAGRISSKLLKNKYNFNVDPVESGRIKGKLYLVGPEHIKRLDEHMRNGVEFRRVRVRTIHPHYFHKKDGSVIKLAHIVRADMYLGIKEYWEDQLDGGFRFSLIKCDDPPSQFPFIKRYYHYTLADHNEFSG